VARVDADLELVSAVDDPAGEADESEADGLDAAVGPAGAEGVPLHDDVEVDGDVRSSWWGGSRMATKR